MLTPAPRDNHLPSVQYLTVTRKIHACPISRRDCNSVRRNDSKGEYPFLHFFLSWSMAARSSSRSISAASLWLWSGSDSPHHLHPVMPFSKECLSGRRSSHPSAALGFEPSGADLLETF